MSSARVDFAWQLNAARDGPSQRPPGSAPAAEGLGRADIAAARMDNAAVADAVEAARDQLNSIISYWKDAVGPEQDSSMGRSNQVTKASCADEGNPVKTAEALDEDDDDDSASNDDDAGGKDGGDDA
ncbi:hypothetical protein MSPP1_003495 [Malassezia sp. CBS 17886]|nr:hypothetical protein MSPP1_003495 [Malassezia sp. CBS 17886]